MEHVRYGIMPRRGWKGVNIPEGLYDEIKNLIERNPGLGYNSVSAFVADAVRSLLREVRKYELLKRT